MFGRFGWRDATQLVHDLVERPSGTLPESRALALPMV